MKLRIRRTLVNGFDLLKKNPIIFVPALISAILSVYLLYAITTNISEFRSEITQATTAGNTEVIMSTVFRAFSTIIPVIVLSSLITLFLTGMIIRMAYDASRRKVSLTQAAKIVAGKYITLLVAGIISGILIMLGYVALFIPGIFLMVKLFFYPYGILIDNEGVIGSLKRSWKVTKGSWWKVAILVAVFAIASSFISQIGTYFPDISFISGFLISLIIMPWQLTSFTLAYLQLKR